MMRESVSIFKQVASDLHDIANHRANYPTLSGFISPEDEAVLNRAVDILNHALNMRTWNDTENRFNTDWAYQQRFEARMARDAATVTSENGYMVSVGVGVTADSAEEAVRLTVEHLAEHAGDMGYRVEQYNAEGELAGSQFLDAEAILKEDTSDG